MWTNDDVQPSRNDAEKELVKTSLQDLAVVEKFLCQ